MTEMTAPQVTIPDHVPADKVQSFNIFAIPPEGDIFAEMAKAAEEMPDIFYNPTPQLDRSFTRGAWTVTSYDYTKEILSDPELFSSVGISGFGELVQLDYDLMIPIDIDPPLHTEVRGIIRDRLMPGSVKKMEDEVRELAKELVDGVAAKGGIDFVDEIAATYPTRMFLLLMGLPQEEADQFLEWEAKLLQPDPNDIQKTIDAILSIVERVRQGFRERQENPQDDFLTMLVNAEIDGEPISEELRLGLGFNLFVGGLDTVMNQLTWVFKHLAQNADVRQHLRDNPADIAPTIEEVMRTHSVLTTRRFVTQDVEFHGMQLKKGDSVEMPLATANQDSRIVECPHQIDITRKTAGPNRQIGFGFGPHTCIGMHLARLEMRLLVEEWLKAIPEFEVKEGETLTFHPGIFGLNNLPLTWA